MKRLAVALAFVTAAGTAAADPPPPTPTVKLVGAGKAPQKPLRVTPAKGTRTTLIAVEDGAVARGLHGAVPPLEKVPTVTSTIDLDIVDVTAAGDARYNLVYRDVSVADDKARLDAVKLMRASLAGLVGTTGHGTISPRGFVTDVDLVAPKGAGAEMQKSVETLRALQTQIMAPLPDEPVGVGATWTTSLTAKGGEVTMQQEATFELVELTGTRAKLSVTLRQQGKGKTGNMTTAATGTGEIVLDLARLGPTSAKLEMRLEVEMDLDSKRLALVKTTTTTMTSRPRP